MCQKYNGIFPFDQAIPLSDIYLTDTPAHVQKSAKVFITALLVIVRVETTKVSIYKNDIATHGIVCSDKEKGNSIFTDRE